MVKIKFKPAHTAEWTDKVEQKDGQNNESTLFLKLEYTITKEQFLEYNRIFAVDFFRYRRRKTLISCTIELILAVFILFTIIRAWNNSPESFSSMIIFVLIDALLMAMGLYGILYHKVFFQKKLDKATVKAYENNQYLKEPVTLKFFTDHFSEKTSKATVSMDWQEISEIKIYRNIYMILFPDGRRSLFVPKTALGQKEQEFEQFLKETAVHYGKKITEDMKR